MAEPILAASDTWFTQGGTSIKRASITEIEIKDSYTPAGAVDSFWDASAVKDGSVMAYVEGTKLIIAGNGSGKIYANPDSSYTFSDINKKDFYTSATAINGLDLLDTSKTTNMSYMFRNASKVVVIDASNFDTSLVTSMRGMFSNAIKAATIDVSTFNTSNVTDMYLMFSGKIGSDTMALTALDLSNWDVSKVTTMAGMFQHCTNLTTIGDTTNWNLEACTTTQVMFYNCASLGALNTANWDVSKVTTMAGMFQNCTNLTTIGDTTSWDVSKVTSMKDMFWSCESLTTIGDTTNWNPKACTNMNGMFSHCTSLEELNVFNWDVSKVTTFKSMFSGGNYGNQPMIIKELDVSKWDTSSAMDMSFMFYGCKGPKTIDVSSWDVSKVTNFDHMIAHSGLTLIGVDNWEPSAACTNMNAMFHSIKNTTIDVSKYNTSKVTVFDQMFQNGNKLTKIIGLENFDTSAGLGFSEMFQYCSSLKELDLSSFDTTKAKDGAEASTNGSYTTTMSDMFTGATSLSKITLGENFSFNGDGTTTNPAHYAVLPTPAGGFWYSSDGTAYAPADVPSRKADTYYATADREDRKINWGKLLEIYCLEGFEIAWLYYKRMNGVDS